MPIMQQKGYELTRLAPSNKTKQKIETALLAVTTLHTKFAQKHPACQKQLSRSGGVECGKITSSSENWSPINVLSTGTHIPLPIAVRKTPGNAISLERLKLNIRAVQKGKK